ncbi:MAG TPA: hypothetical protein ENG15_01625 [Thermotoga sp.]|nr:hypothetical protein [Thermotoga sp.]
MDVESLERASKRILGFSLGPILSSLLSFITVPVTTWLVDPENMGKASMYFLSQGIFFGVASLAMGSYLSREFPVTDRKREVLFNVFVISLLSLLFFSLILWLLRRTASLIIFREYKPYLILLLILQSLLTNVENLNNIMLIAEHRSLSYSLLVFLKNCVYAGSVIIILIFFKRNYEGIILSSFLSVVFSSIFGTFLNRKYWKFDFKLDERIIKGAFRYSLPLIPNVIFSWIVSSMDRVALRKWADFNEVGIYSAGYKVVSALGILRGAFSNFWWPIAFRWYERGVDREKFVEASKMVVGVMSLAAVSVSLMRFIIVMILAPSYRESAVVMPFLVLIPVMTTISTVTGIGISLKRRTEFHTLITGLTALLNFTGNVILVPKYGAIGASIATGVSYIFMFVLRTFISHKLFPVNYPFSFIFSNILLVSLSAFVNLLPWFYVSMILQVGIFSLLVLINIRNIILLLRAGMNILKKIRKKMVK